MSSINRATIMGNLGRDPEIRATQSGEEIANLSLATAERWKDKNTGEWVDKTEWHRVAIFNPHFVGLAKKLSKGAKIYLEGQIQTRKWTDKGGVEKYSTEIVLPRFGGYLKLLTPIQKDSGPDAHNEAKQNGYAPQGEDLDDEMPF